MKDTHVCDDCVVTFIVERESGDAGETTAPRPLEIGARSRPMRIVIDADEERALRTLGDGGLAPRLRYRPKVG